MSLLIYISTFFTSLISGIIGMGGGVLLLSVMTLSMPLTQIIPLHGLIQLVSNSSRIIILRKFIIKKYTLYFLAGLPFGVILSVLILKTLLSDVHGLILILFLIIYSLFKPKKLPTLLLKDKGWAFLGLICGILALIIGTIGPVIAPFFVRDDLCKEEIVATKGSMQMLGHFTKIPAFIYLDFPFQNYLFEIFFLSILAIIGTKCGVLLLGKVDNKKFKLLYKTVLGLSAIRIVYKILIS